MNVNCMLNLRASVKLEYNSTVSAISHNSETAFLHSGIDLKKKKSDMGGNPSM